MAWGKSVSSEVTTAAPMAVVNCGRKPSIAWSSATVSVVGGCTRKAEPEKPTIPILIGWSRFSMKALAAIWEALMRLGATSAARIEPDTSIAMMMVPPRDASVTTAIGRAMDTAKRRREARSSAAGTWRR